jgi:hypothetical protein
LFAGATFVAGSDGEGDQDEDESGTGSADEDDDYEDDDTQEKVKSGGKRKKKDMGNSEASAQSKKSKKSEASKKGKDTGVAQGVFELPKNPTNLLLPLEMQKFEDNETTDNYASLDSVRSWIGKARGNTLWVMFSAGQWYSCSDKPQWGVAKGKKKKKTALNCKWSDGNIEGLNQTSFDLDACGIDGDDKTWCLVGSNCL